MVTSFDLLQHYPDRWRELKEIQAIVDTDVTPVVDENGVVVSDVHTLQHLYNCMEQELNNSLIIPYADTPGTDKYALNKMEDVCGIPYNPELTMEERIKQISEVTNSSLSMKDIKIRLNGMFCADVETCKRWEKMLGIVPNTGATLEDRIFVIKLKLFQTAPYSINKIQYILDNLIGSGQITLIRDIENKRLEAIVSLKSRFQVESVRETLDNMIPANMELTMKIDYTTYDDMAKYDHDHLSQYTHDEIPITEM